MVHYLPPDDTALHPRAQIEQHFARYAAAMTAKDWPLAISLFAPDARGNHAELGPMPPGRQGILDFMAKAPATWDLQCVWHHVHGNYVLYKWKHILPGRIQADAEPCFYGYCELHYGALGFDWLMSFPDWNGMKMLKQALSSARL